MRKKVMVTLNQEQYENLCKSRELGESDSEKLRNSFIIYYTLRDVMDVIRSVKG